MRATCCCLAVCGLADVMRQLIQLGLTTPAAPRSYTANDDTTMSTVKKENADSDLYGGKCSSNVPETHHSHRLHRFIRRRVHCPIG